MGLGDLAGGFSGLGALIGGGLGAVGGGSRPAGSTTSTTAGTSSSVQDLPDWLKPYVVGNLNAATGVRNGLDTSGIFSSATPELLKTINGGYLTPGSNPYLDQVYNHAAGLVGAGVDSRFEASGRYGSNAHAGSVAEALSGLAGNLYGGAYNAERGRQTTAELAAPTYGTGTESAALYPYLAYSGLIPNLRTATGSTTGSETTPYFNNPMGNAASGALLGGILGGKGGLPGIGDIGSYISGLFSGGGGAAAGAGAEAGAADLLPYMAALA